MTAAIIVIFLLFLAFLLVRTGTLSQFVLNAILGLLCCVAAVCISPTLSLRFSFNLFTAFVSAIFGPAGVAGLLALMWLWEM